MGAFLFRLEVIGYIFQAAIAKNQVFRNNEDLIEFLIPKLEMQVFLPEDMVVRQGEEGHEMFFIASGDCQVSVKDSHREDSFVRNLTRGRFFGVSQGGQNRVGNIAARKLPTQCLSKKQKLLSCRSSR